MRVTTHSRRHQVDDQFMCTSILIDFVAAPLRCILPHQLAEHSLRYRNEKRRKMEGENRKMIKKNKERDGKEEKFKFKQVIQKKKEKMTNQYL